MKTTYVPSEEMTNLRNSHNLHRLPSQAMLTIKHSSVRTLQVLIAALTMLFAVGVNGAWAIDVIGVSPNTAPANTGYTQTIAPGIVMTWGADTWNPKSNSAGITVGTSTMFKTYYTGSNNSVVPTNSSSAYSGATVEFEPEYSGYITVVAYYQKGKKPLVVDETGTAVTGIVNVGADGTSTTSVNSGSVLDSNADFNGGLKFPVVAGKKYYVGCSGSKMVGIYGFIYTHDDVSISAAPTITTDLEPTATASYGIPYKFSIKATGNVESYKWFRDGVEVVGVNGPVYPYVSTVDGTSNVYCEVKNSVGTTNSTTCAVSIVRSSEKKLLEARFSNSFLGFIKDNAVKAYYLSGGDIPTLESTQVSDYATASELVDGKITVTAQNETTQDYPVTLTSVTPLAVTPGTDIQETTFTGEESWVKTGYAWTADRGWKFSKNADDGRIQDGRTRLYFFVGKSKSVTLTNTGVDSDRDIKVYVNGVEQEGITKIGKSSGSENSITINTSTVDGSAMIAIISNQVGGDGGFTKYSVVAPDAVSPDPEPTPELIPFSMIEEATTAAAHYPTEWEAGHEVALPQGLPEFTATNTFYINAAAYGASTSSADNTTPIQAALNAVPAEGGMVVVPEGEWLTGPLTIKSKTVLHLKDGAVLKLLPFAGVNVVPAAGSGKYPVNNSNNQNAFTYKMFLTCADNATDIVVEGDGDGSIIEGQGGDWWPNRNSMSTRPPLIRFQKGSRFLFRNFKLQNSPGTNLALSNSNGASDFTVHNVTIKNPSSIDREATADGYTAVSHNTDGIPVWGARVNIYDCLIDTGDDNIVFDSDSQYGHVWNCTFKRGHGASFGSYTERVHHIIYEGITFDGTSAGFRIKTQRGRSGNDQAGTNANGSVHDIICRNSEMTNVTEPIVLTTHYDQEVDNPENFPSAAVTYQTPEYKDFLFKDITVHSIGNCYSGFNRQRPIYIYGLPEQKIHDITFDNVKITAAKPAYLAYCEGVNFTNGTTITNTADATEVIGTQHEASWTGSLLPSDLAVADGKGTVNITVGDEDKALVNGTDYTTSSEGAVTLSSSNEAAVTIVDGKIHAVAAGTAKVTISQAELDANGIYGAGEVEITVKVAAEPVEKTLYSWESTSGTAEGVVQTGGTATGNLKTVKPNETIGNIYAAEISDKAAQLRTESTHLTINLSNGTFKEGDKITIYGFYNKGEAKSVSVAILPGKVEGDATNGTDMSSTEGIIKCADVDWPDLKLADAFSTANHTYTLTEPYNGKDKITITRNSAGTNLYITKIEIKGLRSASTTATVTYYDADGTSVIDTDEVEKGSALAFKDGAESKVTVAAGKKFRNWRIGSQNGEKAVEGMTVNDDLDLYAYVTDEEKTDAHNTINFIGFNAEEHDVIVGVRNCTVNKDHGLNMGGSSSEVEFKVAGKTKITLGKCRYAAETAQLIIKEASAGAKSGLRRTRAADDELFSTSAYSATDGETVDFDYDGEAGNLIITCDAQAYLHSLELSPVAVPEPELVTIYSWESPEGTPVETGGTIAYVNGEATSRLNYANSTYYTICLNGSKANIADAEGTNTAAAGHMEITFNKSLKAGDKITITGYRNKNAEGKAASVYMEFKNGSKFEGTEGDKYWTNIYSDDSNADYDSDGNTPNSYTWTVPETENGTNFIKLTRNDVATNLFITKLEVTGVDRPDDPTPTPEWTGFELDFHTAGAAANTIVSELPTSGSAGTTGISFNNEGTAVKDTEHPVVSFHGFYHTNKYVWLYSADNDYISFDVPGPVTISLGKLGFTAGDLVLKDNSGNELHSYDLSGTPGYSSPATADNVVSWNYTGGAATLKITGANTYLPYMKVEPYEVPAPSRTFVDFKIDFRTKDTSKGRDYTVTLPANGELPLGVTIDNYVWHDATHGATSATITVPVDGPVKFTIGDCAYGQHDMSVKVGSATAEKIGNGSSCSTETTWIYNNETPATLVFTFTGGFVPYFYAEQCEYIPQVTVTYYDANGTSVIGTDVVDGGSALKYKYGEADVTVATGKKFRNWKNSDGVVVPEGTTLNADLNLYACVTDIEVATKNSEHTYNLTDSKFLQEEHELISITGGSFHDGQHGWAFSNGGKVTLSLAGNATITVGNCMYPQNGTTKIIAKNAADETFGECNAVVSSDGATSTFIYEGGAGDVTLNITGGEAYLHNIKITHTGDLTLPKWDGEKEAWTFATKATNQLNAQELLYSISYVNGQTEHEKKLWIPNGTYDLGTAHNTSIPAGMHLFGESQDGVLIKNQPVEESINQTATFQIDGAGVTLENMTIKCRAPYTPGDGHNAERGVCVEDCGNGSHYINVTLDGLQDTYYSNGAAGMTATFDNCIVRGNVDFFCGNGDITVNNSRLQIVTTHTSGGTAIICAPATYTTETQGYMFNNCIVEAATSEVGCLTSGHSSNLRFNLARAWYAGGSSTMGLDRTPRVTFKDTEFEIKQTADWGGSIGYAQTEERRVFNIINTGIQFSDEAMVINKTNKPFAYATAHDRTNPASVSESNITGGGEYDLEKIMELMGTEGTDYTVGTTKTINGHKAIVLKSDNTVSAGKETRMPMDDAILNAIKNNDIIVLDGSGTSTDFVVSKYIRLSNVNNKTIVGINGARLCTEWYLTDYFKSLLENVPTSSGTGVNSASTTSGGGVINIIDNKGVERPDSIKEEGEYLTRKTLLEATGDKNEKYRYSGVFYIDHSSNLIIRNFKFIGPGSLDCAGYDLMAIIDGTNHCWVDHCEFVDGMDGNFDITNGSDFITVSWCKFYYTDRSYAHQNTNLVGSSDDKGAMDRGKLNITFAYNEWGANCRARMPMARYGRIHMLNNYYNCAGNSEYAMNPRIESEFLVEGNYWEKGVRRAYNPNGQKAVTWDNNYYADKAADKAGSSTGFTVTVPYQYSSLMLDPHKVPEVVTLNGGAKLYQKPYFTTNLGQIDSDGTDPYEYTVLLSDCEADGLTFSVWAENAHTFQWYMQDIALDGTAGEWTMIDGENRNTYTYKPQTGITFNLKCKAFGVSGETESDVLKVTVDGESKPIYITDLDETKTYNVVSGSPQIFTVNAGTDGVTYQWYKSANADGSNPTAISGATDRSYTYNPTATTGEIVYLFCRATNQQGDTDSKIVKVKGIYRNVKFHMYATYDANDNNSSVYVVGGTSNINDVGTTSANITADTNGSKAKADKTEGVSGLKFECAVPNVSGVYAQFTPTTSLANGDKIEVSMNTSSATLPDNRYGFYVSKTPTITGDEDSNILKKMGIPSEKGKSLCTDEITVTEEITSFYLIPFVKDASKNVNLANVVVYSGETVRPADAPAFTRDIDASYEVSQDGILELEVDYDDNDVSAVQWYKNTTNSNTGGTIISGATGKKYSVPTSELGITYYYAVITGKDAFSEETATSAVAKVVVKAKAAGTITYIYDMKNIPGGVTDADQTITGAIEIPANDHPDKTILYTPKDATGSTYKNDGGKTFGTEFTSTAYLKANGKTESKGNHFKIDIDKDDATITVYTRSGGSSARGAIVFDNLSSIPTGESGAILYVSGYENGSAIDGYGTTAPLKKGTYYVGVTNNSYIYAIKVTEPEDATAPKEIVHYKIANDASLTKDTEYEAELGKILFGNVSITKITPAEGDPFSGNKLDGDPAASGTKYAKIIMPEGMPVKEGDIIKLSGFQEKSNNPSNVGFAIYPTRAEGMTKETALYFTKAKDILEEFEYKVPAGSNLIDKTEFFVFRDGANTVFFHEITITREMKAETECSKPVGKKGTWNATAEETWNYTISSSTATAVIHYQVNSGEEIVASVAPKNSVNVALKPGDKVKAWATDSQNKIDDSEVNEFTVADKPQTAKPTITVALYSVAKKGFDVTISGTAAGAKVYYTTDGTDPTETSTLYNNTFVSPGDMTIKAIAIEDHYNNSDIASANIAKFDVAGTEDINVAHGSASNENNVGVSYFVLGSEYNAGGIETKDPNSGIKFRVNKTLADVGGNKTLGFRIKVNEGFVINKLEAVDAYSNAKESDKKGYVTVNAAYVDVTDGNYAAATSVLVKDNLVLPYSDKTHSKELTTKDNINARTQVDFVCTLSPDAKINQAGILFRVYYEVIDAPKSVTINGEKLSDADYSTLTTSADKTVTLTKEYNGTPTIIMNTEKGYEHPMVNVASDDAYRKYQCTIMGTTYTIKAMVESIEAPFADIAEEVSLAGGYKVTVTPDPTQGTVAMISIDGGEYEVYDAQKTYYALKTVDTKTKYTKDAVEKFTDVRSLNCPDNTYTAGKPFAVYLYVNGYQDNQTGAHIYNNQKFGTNEDKIYAAVANQFNVIPLNVSNSDAILDKRPDITDAKLVVITETLGGSGSVEIEGVGNKSNMMALTLKRDVLDHTNVLNLKMFLNGSSAANNLRWQWAQPRAMASELTSIMPCTPDGGGMYEIFGNATMSRDASINLWDDINTENMLYHLQPVFNFNEDNATRPNFTPLALVIDPEEPEDQKEEYHAIHFYEKNDFQYVGFGLSINEWPQYNNNVYAIIDKIGEMIIADKSLDSKLTGIVKPQITDNGDGSANVFNNNLNADTYYVVYTKSEYDALEKDAETGKVIVPVSADEIINGSVAGHTTFKANDTDFHTQKYTEKMYIFAVSKLGTDATSEVVEGTVEGSSIRYVIRENEDPAAQGMVAKYPFTVSESFNMPYNQSWKKDGYTVKEWEVVKSSDPSLPSGSTIVPGTAVSGLTQDITVKAIWSENTKAITDLGKNESKEQRTVTWEFLQSKGAPALAMERTAGNMQAILVGQAKFRRDSEHPTVVTDWIDVPMTINTDNLAVLPDNGTEYHGKFNNVSTNWAKELETTDAGKFKGSDYAQVRTGAQFTFPAVYGMNVVYKQVDLVESVNGVANGNVNRSQVSQSFLTDGTKTADVLNSWKFVNPGFQLDANRKIVMVDGVAQLAKTSPMYAEYGEKGRELGLYDEENGGNHVNGGLIYYTGDGTEATMTSVESAQYVHVGATTGKTLGGLNYGSVFMQSLSVVYPELYDLTCTWNPAKSELDPEENSGKIEKLNDPRPNCGGRYVLYDDINLKLTPAYGYYVDVDNDDDPNTVDVDESYYFMMDDKHPGQALNLVGATSKIYRYKDDDPDPEHNANYSNYPDDIKANIPEDGAYVTMKVQDIDLVVSMKKWPTVKYNVEVEPSTYGYITFNSGNGRPHEDEYEKFPVGKKLYVTAHPNTGYKFKEWRRKGGSDELISTLNIPNITLGDGNMVNPFDKNDFLETNELMFIAGTDNHGYNDSHKDDFTYVAVLEKAVTGTGYYEFDYALLKTEEGQAHTDMTPIEVTSEDKNQFPSEFTSQLLNFPKYFTLFKPGYTLDHWVEISGKDEIVDEKHVFTPGTFDGDAFTPSTEGNYTFGKSYNPGSFYNFEKEGEVKHLVPVFTKNVTSYDYRATPVDIKWDLRVAQRAQRVNFKSGTNGNTAADTKIYYSTQATINGDVHIDVPLTITLGNKGKFVNVIEEEDKWCALGEGTEIQIPSGLGAKFTIASLSKMETTAIDGVVPTSYTVENIDGADVYLYTYTTQSEATSVTLKIGNDFSYYKYIRAELPSADAVPLTTTVNNPAFGTVEIAKARTTADTEDNEALLKKINATKVSLPTGEGQGEASYTLGLGTIVSLHAKREHLYVLDYFEDGEGHKYYYNKDDATKHLTVKDKEGNDITAAATAVDKYLMMEKVQDFNTVTSLNDIQLTFQVQSYSESMHAVYKENTLYQVNYTSGEEAEGEAPGMTLVENGESFTVPAENHHLYVDGQTLRYWIDEDGNKYDLGQSYTLGQTFTASKNLPSGITNGNGFTVPKKDLFLSPVFKVNDFTVLNLSTTATAKWPLSRKGGATYEGNGDIVINYEGINGIYVTPLKVEDANGNVVDFIDLKMDIRGENGKANNVNSTDRCQVNSGTVFGVPSSSNCSFTLKSSNSDIKVKVDGGSETTANQTLTTSYTGDKTQIDINFTGNTYLYAVEAVYKPVTTELPELDYATVGNISLGALGTPLAGVKLSTLKKEGEVSGVRADLSNSTTGIMPVVRGTATRGGYVEVTQATIDNPVATMLVKTQDGVTVSVYKIGFTVTYPNIAPRVTDLKIDRKYQCDLKKMYEKAIEDTRVDGTNYINDEAYLKYLGVDGDNAVNERVNVNGVINIKFSTKMAETVLPAATFQANNDKATLGQAVYSLEGQTLTFTYKGLAVNTEYDFIIPAGTFKDVFWAESTELNKPNHVYNEDIRLHFTTVETAITTERRVINYVVTHNQASHFDATEGKMVADGARVQVASDELIRNLEAAGIEHGTLDHGVELANAYNEAGKRFYIFVPDGEYQLMGNDFVKSVSSPIGEDGKTMTLGKTENVYSGITTISKDNVSITGQSQEKTIVYNHPAFEGLSNASTLKLNGGIANFYAQDMTLQNRFDFLRCRKVSSKAVAPALWDRSKKPIFKNVKFDSYQDTYYTNANSQFDDTRGYAEDCTIMGYVDFICGDGDDWFQNCNMVVRQGVGSSATNMFAPRQYDTQKWGYVMDHCTFTAENKSAFDVNNGKMTIARPWANSPAETLIECTYDVLSTDDGYKKMTGGGLIMRMQEYKSYDSDGKILDLSKRSLRNSTPGIGSYDAVMTPSKAAEYNLYDVMGGEDGYDPTLYTAQVNMPKTNGIKQDDTFLTWDDQKEALCYFLFMSDTENGDYKLFAVTDGTEFEMGNAQINKWFIVRAANQRGGLGEPTDKFQYKAHESYKRELINNNQVIDGWRWSTIYLDFDAKAPVIQHQKVVDGVPAVDDNGDPVMEDEIFVYALVKVDATKLTFKRVKIMEKNVGYLVKARPRPEEYEFKYTEKTPVFFVGDVTLPQYRASKELKENDLPNMSLMNGSVVNKSATGISGYTLASKTSYGLGFYKYTGSQYNAYYGWLDAALVAEAQKALADGSLTNEISAQERQAAKAGYMRMVFDDDIAGNEGKADDITDIFADPSRSIEGIYTLSGQRITEGQLQPGRIYIINGKKVLVK